MSFETIARHIDEMLEHENWFSLNRLMKADLIALCQERGLTTEGSKAALIQALMDWKLSSKSNATSPMKNKSLVYTSLRPSSKPGFFGTLFQDDFHETVDEIPVEALTFGRKLGSGGFKDCFEGTYRGEPVAIGELRVTDFSKEDFDEIKHEINVLKQLRHENIVRFIGVSFNSRRLCIVTELCDNGDLYDYMRKVRIPSFSQQVMFMHDIALGISYLHTRRPSIIHRDLKSMNILITADNRAKINDFGLARIRPRMNTLMHTQCGTPNWQAPEMWAPKPSYTEKVDIYSCGLIFWEILQWGAEPYPYHDMNEHELYVQVRDEHARPSMSKIQSKYPLSLLQLVEDMWHHNPPQRPSMTQVVERLLEYLS